MLKFRLYFIPEKYYGKQKKKKTKENGFLIFGFIMKNMKENHI